jgi:dTDP-4-amino-4,6-dideoxy-D-glucose acyltransferase
MAPTSFLTESELEKLGLGSYGRAVQISRFASIHDPERVHLADHVRIDDFAVLTTGDSGRIDIGSYVHVPAHSALFGRGGIKMDDYSGLSARVTIFSTNDDYSGTHLTNPTVPAPYTGVNIAPVHLKRHVIVGSHSVILPGVTLGEGVAVGALSLVDRSLEPWGIYAGIPAKLIRPRSKELLSLEAQHRAAADEAQA